MNIEYGWELVNGFKNKISEWFPNTHQRKFSMVGNGIYDLIIINNDIYEIKVTEAKKMLDNTGTFTTNNMKNKILNNIIIHINKDVFWSVDKGKITLKVEKFIIKIEVIKKLRMPD